MTNFLKKTCTLLLAFVVFAGSGLLAQTHDDGMAAMQLEDWDEAIKVYTAITKQTPTDQPAWLTLGSAYLAKGDKDKAKATFTQAFDAKSEGGYAMIATGRILLLNNDYAKADETFSRTKRKFGRKDVNIKRLVGESFLYELPNDGKRPNFTRAEKELKEAMDQSSKDFPTLMSLAYCYKEIPNGGLAAQHYEYAIRVSPNSVLAQFMLAKVYRAAKIHEKFLDYIDKTIALDPTYTPALRSKAEFLYFDKKWEKATDAAKALVSNGLDIKVEDEMLLANLLYITKDCPACSKLVDKILQKDGSKNYLRRLQAYCDFDNGNYPEGLKILEDFFKQVPPEKIRASDYDYLARLQLKTGGDTVTAVANFNKVMEMDSSKWTLNEEIAKMYYKAKDYCNARFFFQAYIDSLTENQKIVNSSFSLGLSHFFCTEDTLHFVKAEKAFTVVTELVPNAGTGWYWLARSAKDRDPDIVANPELIEEFGVSAPYYEKYAEIASEDKEKNKKDLISAYSYLSYFYFSRNDDENATINIDKLLELDPENESGIGMKEAIELGTPETPGTPATPVENGGN